jgi:hypothetical protein
MTICKEPAGRRGHTDGAYLLSLTICDSERADSRIFSLSPRQFEKRHVLFDLLLKLCITKPGFFMVALKPEVQAKESAQHPFACASGFNDTLSLRFPRTVNNPR